MNDDYICECCKSEFIKTVTDEYALKEFEYYFEKNEPKSIVCDECFNKIMEFNNRKLDYK